MQGAPQQVPPGARGPGAVLAELLARQVLTHPLSFIHRAPRVLTPSPHAGWRSEAPSWAFCRESGCRSAPGAREPAALPVRFPAARAFADGTWPLSAAGHGDYAYQQSSYTEQSYDRSFEESTQHYYESGKQHTARRQARGRSRRGAPGPSRLPRLHMQVARPRSRRREAEGA